MTLKREMGQRRILLSIATQRCAAYWDRANGIPVDISSQLERVRERMRALLRKRLAR